MAITGRWQTYIDNQHRRPHGLVGRLIGERMRRQHTPETDWTLALLGIQPADRVLELGFGVGRGLQLALGAARHGHVVGVDLSADMLRAASRRNRAARAAGRLELVRGDIAAMPLGAARFNKIFSIHTLYFWPNKLALSMRLAGLLAAGGRMVSTFATAKQQPGGEWEYWDVQRQAEQLQAALNRMPGITARLERGPNSRQFNNVALVLDKH
jgi:SAM-dependent methyltransferase